MTETSPYPQTMPPRPSAARFFPRADTAVADALHDQPDALARYLAQVSDVTVAEVREILAAFGLDAAPAREGRTAA